MDSKCKKLDITGQIFEAMAKDINTNLNRTVGNMEMKGASDAVITVKIAVSLEKARSYTENGAYYDVTKPKFKYDVSSVMQVKDKMSGQVQPEMGLVYDEETDTWVLRHINSDQMSMFDDGEDTIEGEFKALPAAEEDDDEGVTPYGWLQQFVGCELKVVAAMGEYTVRTEDNDIILSTATDEESPFYCPPEVLAGHSGDVLACVENEGRITIFHEESEEVIFEMYDPDEDDVVGDDDDFEPFADGEDGAEEEEYEDDDEEYEYEEPEA